MSEFASISSAPDDPDIGVSSAPDDSDFLICHICKNPDNPAPLYDVCNCPDVFHADCLDRQRDSRGNPNTCRVCHANYKIKRTYKCHVNKCFMWPKNSPFCLGLTLEVILIMSLGFTGQFLYWTDIPWAFIETAECTDYQYDILGLLFFSGPLLAMTLVIFPTLAGMVTIVLYYGLLTLIISGDKINKYWHKFKKSWLLNIILFIVFNSIIYAIGNIFMPIMVNPKPLIAGCEYDPKYLQIVNHWKTEGPFFNLSIFTVGLDFFLLFCFGMSLLLYLVYLCGQCFKLLCFKKVTVYSTELENV